MSVKIALAGNPNSGKTTLFNALTGSNQFVGNWPGVTVEKKEGRLRGHKDVTITDLPGIYSLSPYTLEEVVARRYILEEKPDAILNIVDGSNLERNLYLTTQLTELGIPVVMAVNMMDVLEKRGDAIDLKALSDAMGCEVVAISALKGTGVAEAEAAAVRAAEQGAVCRYAHKFSPAVEGYLSEIKHRLPESVPEALSQFYAVKLFERDEKIMVEDAPDVSDVLSSAEEAMDDDTESIITNERYTYIASIIKSCYKKRGGQTLSVSDKIDRVLTNRFLALPIFAVIMFLVYYISVTTVGSWGTDWANDGLFGDGFHLCGIGTSSYEAQHEAIGILTGAARALGEEDIAAALAGGDEASALAAAEKLADICRDKDSLTYETLDEETLAKGEVTVTGADVDAAAALFEANGAKGDDPAAFGIWVPGIPVMLESALSAIGCADWLCALILDGIVEGVGSVLGFVPQMLVLFLFLAFLEGCGYMARIAFIMDRIFRKFGLSGKSFIPILIGTGCGVPGIMASRTIENERDRRMTIMTTTFIPCSAKLPLIAMMAGAIFGGAAWVAPSAYFLGMAAIICSGILLKKTKRFAGEAAPFVMELPAYHWPTAKSVLRSMWERGWSFIKRAGTIILLSTILVWFTSFFGFVDGSFRMLSEEELSYSLLATLGGAIAWIFTPLGFGNWQSAVASVTGLVAKENIVGTLGVLYGGGSSSVYETMATVFTGASGYAFLLFNLLCAPCFAAIGAIRREMNSAKWTWFAVFYQCLFAYGAALVAYQAIRLATGGGFGLGTCAAAAVLLVFFYLLFRPQKKARRLPLRAAG